MTTPKRTPEQWRAGVDKIKDMRVRRHAACVILWDCLGKFQHIQREEDRPKFTALDVYVEDAFDKPSLATEDELYEALIIAGYTKTDAFNRSRDKGYQKSTPSRYGAKRRKTDPKRQDMHRGALTAL